MTSSEDEALQEAAEKHARRLVFEEGIPGGTELNPRERTAAHVGFLAGAQWEQNRVNEHVSKACAAIAVQSKMLDGRDAEIAQLKDQLAQGKQLADADSACIKEQQADIARLREALARIANGPDMSGDWAAKRAAEALSTPSRAHEEWKLMKAIIDELSSYSVGVSFMSEEKPKALLARLEEVKQTKGTKE
jgi:hypothetical protein